MFINQVASRSRDTLLCVCLILSSGAFADDIEVFGTPIERPNVLLVLDYSNSMKRKVPGPEPRQERIDVLRSTITTVVEEFEDRIDFGLGPLFAATSGGIRWPVDDVTADASTVDPSIPYGKATSKDIITSLVNETGLKLGTATAPAFAEAALYFSGKSVRNGGVAYDNAGPYEPNHWLSTQNTIGGGHPNAPHPATYSPTDAYQSTTPRTGFCRNYRPSEGSDYCDAVTTRSCRRVFSPREHMLCEYDMDGSFSPSTYRSPITAKKSCEANIILMLSDGKPSKGDSPQAYEDLLGYPSSMCEQVYDTIFEQDNPMRAAGNCAIEIADKLATSDVLPSIPGSRVNTHTVGFGLRPRDTGRTYLERVAEAGRGRYFGATTADELHEAFREILTGISGATQSFGSVAVGVDRAQGTNDDRAYLPLFKPEGGKYWQGNLKGYYIGSNGLESLDRSAATHSSPDGIAFHDDAQSFWSRTPDGANVGLGGASGRLVPEQRKLLTFIGDTSNIAPAGVPLMTTSQHVLDVQNSALTKEILGAPRDTIVPWLASQPMGAPLHSNLVTVDYDNRRVLFGMTTQGFLHAIDATLPAAGGQDNDEGGDELFAFMPQELLPNIRFMQGGGFLGEHIYGLDGGITPWHIDRNNDGKVNGTDKLLIVFGMRRGGSNYYALDVTDPLAPRFAWQISGREGAFAKLAQTWSHPALIEVESGNSSEQVLVFGGGYDDAIDDLTQAKASSGNSIFIVDIRGNLLWSADHSDMQFGIPSDVRAIDSNSDGLADRLYVGDLGGQLWRVDISDIRKLSGGTVLSQVANLSSDAYRPIFYPPVISLQEDSRGSYIAVAFGSGNRDNPFGDRSKGAFFMIKDRNIALGAPASATAALSLSDLYNVTSNEVAQADRQRANTTPSRLADKAGWYLELSEGEKSLSALSLIDGRLMATTFHPLATQPGTCGVPTSESRFYVMDPGTAAALEIDGRIKTREPEAPEYRYTVVTGATLPPSPKALIRPQSDTVDILVGKEVVLSIPLTLTNIFWAQDQ